MILEANEKMCLNAVIIKTPFQSIFGQIRHDGHILKIYFAFIPQAINKRGQRDGRAGQTLALSVCKTSSIPGTPHGPRRLPGVIHDPSISSEHFLVRPANKTILRCLEAYFNFLLYRNFSSCFFSNG